MSKLFLSLLMTTVCLIMDDQAHAATGMIRSSGGGGYSSGSHSSSRQDMMLDLSAHYVRDTKADGSTDTAGRFSIGGMFNEWVGLDAQGLYEVKSKDYLVGGDFRFVPTDWFFLKGGIGAYADKQTHQFRTTPIAGAGILARLNRDYYFVTESTYFSVNDRNNISFGVGLGTTF